MVRRRGLQPGVPGTSRRVDGKGRQTRTVTAHGAGLGLARGTGSSAVFRPVREPGGARVYLSPRWRRSWSGRRSVPTGETADPTHERQTMKARILIGCVALQLLILALMAGQREWVRRTGRAVYFRTAPVDPRDVMRGDYVRLNYDISRVPRESWRGPLPAPSAKLDEQPREGLYIRGRTETSSSEQINVRYGLEALFLEQGKGLELEAGRNRNGIQVPLEVKAAVSRNGIVVLQDHRWCALGMGLNLEA